MRQPKAIFLDMDGTLLREDNYVSEETMTTIQQVRAKDIPVFIATGRGQSEILTRAPLDLKLTGLLVQMA
nr:HAD-IIB family hydrolase [Halolactibacillus sp. JCM 19043]